ncbi:MAG TPA: hypothetical protein PK986_12350, partial [Spirochaetota bacterium]|nr:hypothetical protein [Spirochaetota bacterium]
TPGNGAPALSVTRPVILFCCISPGSALAVNAGRVPSNTNTVKSFMTSLELVRNETIRMIFFVILLRS